MAVFDAELVDRWFSRIAAPDVGEPHVRVEPTATEFIAFAEGRRLVLAALRSAAAASSAVTDPRVVRIDEPAARKLLAYLRTFAAGVAEVRQANTEPPGTGSPLAVATGLISGAAALGDGPAGSASTPERPTQLVAHRAGMVAAETVVTGAGLSEVARGAAAVALAGWTPTSPSDREGLVEHRTQLLLFRLWAALVDATRPPRTGPERASCGAPPGQNHGTVFAAEITFTMFGGTTEVESLRLDLSAAAQEVMVWSDGDRHQFHVHTDRAGETISRAYLATTLFDLQITAREATVDR